MHFVFCFLLEGKTKICDKKTLRYFFLSQGRLPTVHSSGSTVLLIPKVYQSVAGYEKQRNEECKITVLRLLTV